MMHQVGNRLTITISKMKLLGLLVISATLLSVGSAQAQDEPNASGIIVNSTNTAIDVYVVIPGNDEYPEDSSELLQTIQPGQQASDSFHPNETILITRSGVTETVLQTFQHDGTPNKVFVVTEPTLVNSGNVASNTVAAQDIQGNADLASESAKSRPCPKNMVNCDARSQSSETEATEQEPKKPEVIISDDFKKWLQTDKTTYSKKGRTIDESEVKNAFQNQWLLEDEVRHGYNALKMNPSDLTDHGLHTPPNLFDKIGKDSKNWHWDKYKIALSNDLVLHKAEGSFGNETTTMSFTSYEELDSTSTSIGLGAEFQGKGSKGASTKNGNGVKGKIGWGRDESKLESNGETLIRKQQVGRAYWACYVKEYMKLDQEFSDFLLDRSNLRSYAQFKDFFEEYGTHWPLCTYFGGWIRYEERISNTELAQQVKDSLSIGIDAKVPAGKAPVAITGSLDYSKSDETRSKNSESSTRTGWQSKGGTLGAGIGMWQMQEPQNASSYVPVQLELRQMNEIIWPELMGITNAEDANYVHGLRAKMTDMLARYFNEAQGQTTQYDWTPRLYQVELEKVVVTQDDDKGYLNVPTTPSFYGSISVGEGISIPNNSILPVVPTVVTSVWDVKESDLFQAKKLKQFKLNDETALISIPSTPVFDKKIGGVSFYKPSFDYGNIMAVISSSVYEDDVPAIGGDDSFAKIIGVKLQDVENKPNKILKDTVEIEEEDVKLKFHYQVKRVQYEFEESPEVEAARPPKLKKRGLGAAIAAKGSTVINNSVSSSAKRPTNSSNSAEAACYNRVQGKVAWSTSGDKAWGAGNVAKLCKGVQSSSIGPRINCFNSRMPSQGWSAAINACVSGAGVIASSSVGAVGVGASVAGSSSKSAEAACYNRVQGKVAWSTNGDKTWGADNIGKLCKGVQNSTINQRINCFSSRMPSQGWSDAIKTCAGGASASNSSPASAETACYNRVQGKVAWSTSGNKTWGADNVRKLCKGVSSPLIETRVICFMGIMPVQGWSKAIDACQI